MQRAVVLCLPRLHSFNPFTYIGNSFSFSERVGRSDTKVGAGLRHSEAN